MPRKLAEKVIDVTAETAKLSAYWFLGVNGAVTATGFIVDGHGERLGNSFTATIPVASAGVTDGVDIAFLLSGTNTGCVTGKLYTTFPDAQGILINFNNPVWVDIQGTEVPGADFKAHPTQYATFVATTGGASLPLGRITK